jgi:Spirocyclase AveC-like
MSITTNQGVRQEPARITAKPAKPVLWWATFGTVVLVVMVVTVGQWMLSSEFRPAPTGSDAMPAGMQAWINALEIFFTSGMLIMWWVFLIKPWIKAGHITWDGLFLLACTSIWYQDPIDNYFNFTFTYNAHFHNMSSWSNFIPGWQSPRAENFAEPYFFMGSFFMWVFFGISIIGCWLLNKLKLWLPNLSSFVHIIIACGIFCALDFLMESLFTHTGIFAYVAVYSPLSFWAGTAQQFPLYESTGIGVLSTAVILMRYYRDDQGQSFAEKGVQQLSIPQPAKRLLSFLAMVGAIQVLTFVCFYGQYQWFALKADSFAKYPSYQILEICGKGTPYACPTREVPMAKRGSVAISPDDPRLSPESRRN